MPTVTSKDGTTIGYDAVGEGPAIIVVYGAAGYRGAFGDDGELARLLAPHCTGSISTTVGVGARVATPSPSRCRARWKTSRR